MLSIYGAALFLHVVTAILLVGGSGWAHVSAGLLQRSDSVEAARSHVRFLSAFTKAAGPLSVLVLLAGAYMATDAGLWRQGWLLTALVLFVLVGAGAGAIVDPTVRRFAEALDAAPDGQLSPALRADLFDRRLTVTLSLFAAADLTLVFLMTNKPALATSLAVTAVALALGGLWALRELRIHQAGTGVAPAV